MIPVSYVSAANEKGHNYKNKDQDSISVTSATSDSSGTGVSVKQLEQSVEVSSDAASTDISVKTLEQSMEVATDIPDLDRAVKHFEKSTEVPSDENGTVVEAVEETSECRDMVNATEADIGKALQMNENKDTTEDKHSDIELERDKSKYRHVNETDDNSETDKTLSVDQTNEIVDDKYEVKDDCFHGNTGKETISVALNENVTNETHELEVGKSDNEKKVEDKQPGIVSEPEGSSGATNTQRMTARQMYTTQLDHVYPGDLEGVSKLDLEMARLDSYLSHTSEAGESDDLDLSFKHSRDEAEKILLKDSKMRLHGLTEDRSEKYSPSKLEKELAELEKSAMEESTEVAKTADKPESPGYSKSPSSLQSPGNSYTPSIYTVYGKPGASFEDFYSKYAPESPSEMSSLTSISSLSDKNNDFADNKGAADLVPASVLPNFMKAMNSWTEITTPGNIYSMSISATHAWITDRSTNIFYSALAGPGLTWKKASGNASQISVSKDGNIVWALNRGVVSAGTKITAKRPEGMKWVEAVKNVSYICVDDTCAW